MDLPPSQSSQSSLEDNIVAEEVTPTELVQPPTPWDQKIVRTERVEKDMLDFDYDEMYATLNPMTDNKEKNCSIVGQIVSQLLRTMNPSRVRLPTCVLECRSLLESYADAFASPKYFVSISQGTV